MRRAKRPKSSRAFNRQSVQEALRSLSHRLGLYKSTPPNGLALFAGYGEDADGKPKKIVVSIEPFLPLSNSMYKCDSIFHTEMLREQLNTSQYSCGFIIVDGNGCSFHKLTGHSKETLFKWDKVSLPKKHGRGGQSKNRFERIREEKRGWYITKVAELSLKYFIDSTTTLPNVQALVLAGSADLKKELKEELDNRLGKIIVAVVDVQYGGEIGFNEAVNLTGDLLHDVKFVKEKKVLSLFFESIAKDSGRYVIGIEDVIYALESGSLETLILWDQLPTIRHTFQFENEKKIVYSLNGIDTDKWELVKSEQLIDWIIERYKEFGSVVVVVSENSSVGSQFVKGFGGIGGLLRYNLDLPSMTEKIEEDEEDYEW